MGAGVRLQGSRIGTNAQSTAEVHICTEPGTCTGVPGQFCIAVASKSYILSPQYGLHYYVYKIFYFFLS